MKPRLIDANALLRALALEPMENRTYWRANEIVLDQPTAYDIDNVVEQLEKVSFVDIDEEYADDGQIMLFLHDAIEIVKGGVK